MISSSYLTTFTHEVEDLLEKIESAILALETAPGDAELINTLFRAFHTLKGSAGVAGVTSIASFTHHAENAMEHVRSGAIALTPALVSAVLASRDHVAALLASELGGPACNPATGPALVAQLTTLTAAPNRAAAAAPEPARAPASPQPPALAIDYLVSFAPTADPGGLAELDPDALIAELRVVGTCTVLGTPTVVPDATGAVPAWMFLVTTSRGENAIRDAFIFIAGAGELSIERGMSEFLDDPEPEAQPAVDHVAPPAPGPAAGEVPPGPAAGGAPPAATRRRAPDAAIRVSSERLDHLVKLVGELVIAHSRLQEAHSRQPSPLMSGPVESFERLIADLRDSILGLRMMPVGTMFARFHRLIRDLSSELDKEVELVTTGDETELDKTVIDQLGDAVVHVLRNSMDHGLELPDARIAAGKPRRGTLRLSAEHVGTHVVITIADDGRGVDVVAVRRKAEAQGLIQPGEALSEQDTLALITRPGFSTAVSVTQLSGRGVGMEVVKKTVEGLRGSLAITSRFGEGTQIRMTLPLTLAIIDGLLVEIDRDRFIVPMAAVTENLELTAVDRHANNGRNVVALRGELIPYIRLREVFQLGDANRDLETIVVVAVEGHRVGLVVDRVIGSHQTVIHPLGHFYRGIDLFSGTTIMGDGRVAMILDLAGTVRTSSDRGAMPSATPRLVS